MARTPLYKATEQEMIRRITSGAWPVGQRLGNEFELAEAFGVSQGTMRRALITLEGMGLLSRKPGRGTLVAARAPRAATALPAADAAPRLLDLEGRPMRFEVHRAKAVTRGADAEDAALFGTGRLSTLERVLRHAGARVGIDRVVLAETRLPAIDEAAPLDLGDLLAHHGLGADVIDRHATADVTDLQESVTLACDRHAALLVVTETARDAAGGIIAQRRIRVLGPAARFG